MPRRIPWGVFKWCRFQSSRISVSEGGIRTSLFCKISPGNSNVDAVLKAPDKWWLWTLGAHWDQLGNFNKYTDACVRLPEILSIWSFKRISSDTVQPKSTAAEQFLVVLRHTSQDHYPKPVQDGRTRTAVEQCACYFYYWHIELNGQLTFGQSFFFLVIMM